MSRRIKVNLSLDREFWQSVQKSAEVNHRPISWEVEELCQLGMAYRQDLEIDTQSIAGQRPFRSGVVEEGS